MPASVSNYSPVATGPVPGLTTAGQTKRMERLPQSFKLPTGPRGPAPDSPDTWRKHKRYLDENPFGWENPLPWLEDTVSAPLDWMSSVTSTLNTVGSIIKMIFQPAFWLRVILFFWSLGLIIGGLTLFFIG